MLLTDLTSAPDDKRIGVEYCQKIRDKVSPIRGPKLENIADTDW